MNLNMASGTSFIVIYTLFHSRTSYDRSLEEPLRISRACRGAEVRPRQFESFPYDLSLRSGADRVALSSDSHDHQAQPRHLLRFLLSAG